MMTRLRDLALVRHVRWMVDDWYPALSRRSRLGLWLLLAVWIAAGPLIVGTRGAPFSFERPFSDDQTLASHAALVIVDAAPEPPAIALLQSREGRTDVVVLPVTTLVEVPGIGAPQTLKDTLRTAGAEVVAIAAANVLGTEVPPAVLARPPDVRQLVDVLGGVTVRVPETVVVERDGIRHRAFTRGVEQMDGEQLVRFLTTAIPGQNELERVARQHAAWRGLVEAFAEQADDGPAVAAVQAWPSDADDAMIAGLVAGLGDGRAEVVLSTLPVRRAGVAQEDLYRVDWDRVGEAQRGIAGPGEGTGQGRRVRLLIGTDAEVGPAVARKLIDAGYTIVLTGPAEEAYETTRVVMSDDTEELRATAEALVGLMGTGRVGVYATPQTMFDVTLVVGHDWAAAHGLDESRGAQTAGGQ